MIHALPFRELIWRGGMNVLRAVIDYVNVGHAYPMVCVLVSMHDPPNTFRSAWLLTNKSDYIAAEAIEHRSLEATPLAEDDPRIPPLFKPYTLPNDETFTT